MKLVKHALIALLLAPLLAWAQGEDNQVVSMSQVPENVARTASATKPGAYITQVIKRYDNDNLTFRFYASQVGRYWVIVVRDDGSLVEVYESPGAPPKVSG